MIGTNILILCEATMMEIVQDYLDRQTVSAGLFNVISVEAESDNTFRVTTEKAPKI